MKKKSLRSALVALVLLSAGLNAACMGSGLTKPSIAPQVSSAPASPAPLPICFDPSFLRGMQTERLYNHTNQVAHGQMVKVQSNLPYNGQNGVLLCQFYLRPGEEVFVPASWAFNLQGKRLEVMGDLIVSGVNDQLGGFIGSTERVPFRVKAEPEYGWHIEDRKR